MNEPTTEAGRRLLNAIELDNDDVLRYGILAIESEARATATPRLDVADHLADVAARYVAQYGYPVRGIDVRLDEVADAVARYRAARPPRQGGPR